MDWAGASVSPERGCIRAGYYQSASLSTAELRSGAPGELLFMDSRRRDFSKPACFSEPARSGVDIRAASLLFSWFEAAGLQAHGAGDMTQRGMRPESVKN